MAVVVDYWLAGGYAGYITPSMQFSMAQRVASWWIFSFHSHPFCSSYWLFFSSPLRFHIWLSFLFLVTLLSEVLEKRQPSAKDPSIPITTSAMELQEADTGMQGTKLSRDLAGRRDP